MARARTKPDMDVYVPIDGFVAQIDGSDVTFKGDVTRVSRAWVDAHPELAHLFRPMNLHYDVEAATSEPGESRE